jgi:hypothetical protein
MPLIPNFDFELIFSREGREEPRRLKSKFKTSGVAVAGAEPLR